MRVTSKNLKLSNFQYLYNPITGQKGEGNRIINIEKTADQIALNMNEYVSGHYICTLYKNGKKVESISFIVIN
jgi:hypothetical protein